jgi:hypothetical protein
MMTRTMASAAALLAASGCATVGENIGEFSQGWRVAEVLQVAPATRISSPEFFGCIRNATPSERADREFVVLSYRRFGRSATVALPVPRGQQLAPGDTVYANVSSCEGLIVKR